MVKNKVKSPSWTKTAVVYQIYPRSFKDGNNDGIGDINGIIEKLDYLNDGTENSLGIDAIWISPIYCSPMLDFGYDISNHMDIDPMFGNLSDFDRLVKEAHKRNIKIIMDYIPGHTSSQHPWFIESMSSRTNPKRDWYIWKDAKADGELPNNWVGVFGGTRWEFDRKTNQYYLHTFLKEQPDLNWRNPEVQEAMLQVLHFWLKRGVDGFRVDSFNDIYKDNKFLDEPLNPQYVEGKGDPFFKYQHIYTRDQPERNTLVKHFSHVLAQYGDKFMVTESYVDLGQLVELYEAGDSSHAPFNFQFVILSWEARVFKSFIDQFDTHVGTEYLPTYVLGNHDNPRVATRIGKDAARTAAMLQLTLRGMPTIYYGDELGMVEGIIPEHKRQDPFTKGWQGKGISRDPQRTPMQWDHSQYAGFSQHEPWLPVNKDFQLVNVEEQQRDKNSMLTLYKSLLTLRKSSPALLYGAYRSLDLANEHVFAYIRQAESEKLLVILNFSVDEQVVSIDMGSAQILLSTHVARTVGEKVVLKRVSLEPQEGTIMRLLE